MRTPWAYHHPSSTMSSSSARYSHISSSESSESTITSEIVCPTLYTIRHRQTRIPVHYTPTPINKSFYPPPTSSNAATSSLQSPTPPVTQTVLESFLVPINAHVRSTWSRSAQDVEEEILESNKVKKDAMSEYTDPKVQSGVGFLREVSEGILPFAGCDDGGDGVLIRRLGGMGMGMGMPVSLVNKH
ncbi:uncharacterized protein BDR25DRAFT_359808 [Lindgomyces ingoldianus]|uniref:Uncharacterized protein n=1 Tax=Lindgomyces ingoldianus TaxID=673940 RepID=A0ACB6QIR0_9PLEO|nr:uncharacterized protein BDR25DRAFT_359808 [Lindgomyces ingoldianus]KAF2466478.1 hypothetical protein BDR25DRAFT_359808 [Lindgomyces ingoldianus]